MIAMLRDQLPAYLPSAIGNGYLVGGAVRDLLCGRDPTDFDLVVREDPARIAERLSTALHGHAFQIGRGRHAIYRVIHSSVTIDVCALQHDRIESNLETRDFTINAMAYDPSGNQLIDPLNGRQDLAARKVRMASSDGFSQDPVRLLRAYRFAAGLGFAIESTTADQIKCQSSLIRNAAGERVWAELHLILSVENSAPYLRSMRDSGIFAALLSQVRQNHPDSSISSDIDDHSLNTSMFLEFLFAEPEKYLPDSAIAFVKGLSRDTRILLKLSALLHCITGPCAYSRSQSSAPGINRVNRLHVEISLLFRRLRMSSHDQKWVSFVLRHHSDPLNFNCLPARNSIGHFLRQCGQMAPHILIMSAIELSQSELASWIAREDLKSEIHRLFTKYLTVAQKIWSEPPLLDGRALMTRFGLAPSPKIGQIISHLLEKRLEGSLTTTGQAYAEAAAYLRSHRQD